MTGEKAREKPKRVYTWQWLDFKGRILTIAKPPSQRELKLPRKSIRP